MNAMRTMGLAPVLPPTRRWRALANEYVVHVPVPASRSRNWTSRSPIES